MRAPVVQRFVSVLPARELVEQRRKWVEIFSLQIRSAAAAHDQAFAPPARELLLNESIALKTFQSNLSV